ncbi:hypothetical protein [Streptomyces bauhiniae]|uniref:hypothetical protein n=1 Tax=Streptomyces bauhiniae TaxID=2340725 RepID=UPI003650B23A
MKAEVRRARRPKAPAPAPFKNTDEVNVGAVVFDKDRDMPATVRGMDGSFVEVDRPTGLSWRVHFSRIRPASAWERRQLVAVGRLHAQQRRGLG